MDDAERLAVLEERSRNFEREIEVLWRRHDALQASHQANTVKLKVLLGLVTAGWLGVEFLL